MSKSTRFQKNVGKRLGQALSVLGAGVGGVSIIPANLCLQSLFPSEFTGNWLCVHGDGTSHGAGTLVGGVTSVGAPITQSLATNMNGSNMAPTTSQRLDGATSAFKTVNVASPTGDYSWGFVGSHGIISGNGFALGKDDNGANRSAFVTLSTTFGWYNFKADGSYTVITFGDAIAGATQCICGTYKYVTDGTSEMRGYVDGAATGTPSTTAKGPTAPGSGTPWGIGYRPGVPDQFNKMGIRAAFITEKELSAATIAAMSKVALGHWAGSFGEPITFTRASIGTITSADGQSVAKVQPGRPCFVNGGYLSEPAATNKILQSEAFDTTWIKAEPGTPVLPVVTNNTTEVVAPDGSNTASKIVLDAVPENTDGCFLYQEFTATAVPWTNSVWLRTASGSATVYIWFVDNESTPTTCSVTTAWTRFTNTATLSAATKSMRLGVDLRAPSTMLAQPAQTIYAWGAQAELGSVPSSYIPTTTAEVIRAVTLATVPNPLYGLDPADFCFGGHYVPGGAYSAFSYPTVMALGVRSTANSVILGFQASNGKAVMTVRDATNTVREPLLDATVSAGAHDIFGYLTSAGLLTVYVDGVAPAQTRSGAGSGLIATQQATAYLVNTSDVALPATGYGSNFRIYGKSTP